jgi:hypothetical protein
MAGFSTARAYSTRSREFYGPVPGGFDPGSETYGGAGGVSWASTEGEFRVTRLCQTDVLSAIKSDPRDEGHMLGLYDVSLASVLKKVWSAVGLVIDSGSGIQVGTCTLISANLAIMPSHCIEAIKIKDLVVRFGFVVSSDGIHMGQLYPVRHVEESDPALDYAIINIAGAPGTDFSYLPVAKGESTSSTLALLHHPLAKPMQVSVHTYVTSTFFMTQLLPYHDSDYGSSGGAYISPRGNFVAMHLGSERTREFNLLRKALWINEIITKHPHGIISALLTKRLKDDVSYISVTRSQCEYLPFHSRDLFDIEKFDRTCLTATQEYLLRPAKKDLPGVTIEKYQAKHTLTWPVSYPGKKTSMFPKDFGLDDTIVLGEFLIKNIALFNEAKPKNDKPSLIRFELGKEAKKELGNTLYNKLKDLKNISVSAGFTQATYSWSIHFYPDYS